jgi:hypothetical protein
LQTLIIVIGLAASVIAFLLIPALFGRDESSPSSISDLDNSHCNGANLVDSEKAQRQIEYEVKHNQAKSTDFIKKLIWIAAISAAACVVYYIASPYQNCLAKADKNWCSEHTIW